MSRDKMSRRKVGGRDYKKYSDRQMELCLADIKKNVLTQREASKKYKIPRSSIILRLKAIQQNNLRSPGRQCIFNETEEAMFIRHAEEMCNFGFPITLFDLRCIVKMYLDKKGLNVNQFQNNMPGKTWADMFMKRHKQEISQRFCSNIKRVRAAVDEETIQLFFNHLKEEIEGIPSHCIYNYDETNLVDDPGKKKVLMKRGCKYPEAIKNSTKAAVSIMICGNAAGDVLPPYVNYKSEHLWTTWTEGGPANTRYNRSKSGWFDTNSFEDWFFNLLLPVLRRQEGKKLLIGDNLSSHISIDVLKSCSEHNIAFVALPPNSTHLLQPLDVSYFRPLKFQWRQILDQWKISPEGQRLPTIPKNVFPSLLNKLWETIHINSAANLKAGFKKSGIFPTDATPVLQRLPTFKNADATANPDLLGQSFTQYLEEKRKEVVDQSKKNGKRKKLNIVAGKSISAEEIQQMSSLSTSAEKNVPSTSKGRKNNPRKKKLEFESESESEISYESSLNLSEELMEDSPIEHTPTQAYVPKPGDFVAVDYEGESWPGQVKSTEKDGAYVNCMARCGLAWKWPEKEDCLFYPNNDIKFQISAPLKLSTKRALYRVPELDDRWGKPLK